VDYLSGINPLLYYIMQKAKLSPQDRIDQGFSQFQLTPNQRVAGGFGSLPTATPNARVAQGFDTMMPWLPQNNPSQGFPQAGPPVMAQGGNSVPMPMARPAQAPQPQPQMGFFARNAAMMRDPSTGAFIDPTNAALAQSQMGSNSSPNGSALISKMLSLLTKKADASQIGNNNDASTFGGA